MLIDLTKLIAALELHAKALFAHAEAMAGGAEAAPKKTRGRPAAGEVNGVAVNPETAAASAPAASTAAAAVSTTPAAQAALAAGVNGEATLAPVVTEATQQQVADAIIALANNGSREKAVAILTKHGVKKVPELKKEQFAAVLADVRAASAPTDSLV